MCVRRSHKVLIAIIVRRTLDGRQWVPSIVLLLVVLWAAGSGFRLPLLLLVVLWAAGSGHRVMHRSPCEHSTARIARKLFFSKAGSWLLAPML